MRKLIFSTILILMCVSTVHAGGSDEITAIKETAMNYMDSWYKGDADRMKESLHPELAKRSTRDAYDGKKELRQTSATDMFLYTKSGYGVNLWRKNYKIEVVVLDHYKNIASVKVIAPHYLEYLHLLKKDGKWVILNALYENKSPESD